MELKHGDQKKLAEAVGVVPSYINEIVNGNKQCPGRLAVKLELVSERVLGQRVMTSEWILAGLGLRKGVLDAEGIDAGEAEDRAGDCCTGSAACKCKC